MQDSPEPPPVKQTMEGFLQAGHFDSEGRPRVCELYAGAAVMTRILIGLGWTAAMLAECATGCIKFLSWMLPETKLERRVETRPWDTWRQAGLLALIVVAGVSCQPFSEAGPMRCDKDSRAWDAFHVFDAAVALQAAWVVLENVPNYIDQDDRHGVFSKVIAYAEDRGYKLLRVLRPKHHCCGGETYRRRVVPVFLRTELVDSVDLQPLFGLTFDEGVVESPTKYMLDRTRNWALYGQLQEHRGGRYLRFSTTIPVEGAVVKVNDSARSWRVQKRKRDSADLMVTDRRASHRRDSVAVNKLEVIQTEESEYKVYKQGEIVSTVRASGEPPGRGAPLIQDEHGIWSCSVRDRGSLNDFTEDELDSMDAAGLTTDEQISMIGNCAPRRIMRRPLEAITSVMRPFCKGLGLGAVDDAELQDAVSHPIDTRSNVTNRSEDDQRADSNVGSRQNLVLMTVLPDQHMVALSEARRARTLDAGQLKTGRVLEATNKCLAGELKGELLVPAGSWLQGDVETFVVAHVTRRIPEGLKAFTLRQLAGTEAYHLASLALAKVESHASGHTTIEQILPMLDTTGRYRVGALRAKRLDPPTICNGVCTWSREQALAHCRAIEARAELELGAAAEAAQQQDAELSDYLAEWKQQVTVTDLRDVPDDLLSQMPVFDDHRLLRQCFSHTSALPTTDAVQPPVNKEPEFVPTSTADLFKPGRDVLAERAEAEAELVQFFKLMWDGELDDQQVAAARPEPRVWGNDCLAEGAQWTVWDITGEVPQPVDFSKDASNHLDLEAWFSALDDCDDQQLVSYMRHGVMTRTQLDNTTTLTASLVSLRHGLQSISDELKRLEKDGYAKAYDCQPTWPNFTTPIGAVAKKGSAVWRKIVDRGFPWVDLVTADLRRVLAPNLRVKRNLPLPPEIKPRYEDLAVDICTLRYIGDILHWVVVQFADDLKDWFH